MFVRVFLLVMVLLPSASRATTTAFADSASFLSALPQSPGILDFESLTPGTLLPSVSVLDGISFTYLIDGLTLKISDAFDTTSGDNSLGLTGGDEALLDGDEISLDFADPILALGMFFITSDPLMQDEILLVTAIGTAGNSAVEEAILPDGGIVYFVGLTSSEAFSAATIAFADDGEINFAFNVDDITTLPEPRPMALATLGLLHLALVVRGRAR